MHLHLSSQIKYSIKAKKEVTNNNNNTYEHCWYQFSCTLLEINIVCCDSKDVVYNEMLK